MTTRENEIYNLIKKNPLISQQELAKLLKLTRSSVGVHISNLIKKGYIKGKGYVTIKEEYCLVMGGACVELQAKSKNDLTNSCLTSLAVRGTWRNLIEHGLPIKLITALGDDIHSNYIMKELETNGVDYCDSLFLKNSACSSSFSVFNADNQLEISIVSNDIYNSLTVNFIENRLELIQNTNSVIIDTNIPIDIIEFILENYKNKNLFLEIISFDQIEKISNKINLFNTVKISLKNLEKLLGSNLENNIDFTKLTEKLFENNLKQIFITIKSDEIYHIFKHYNGLILSKKLESEKQIMEIYLGLNN
ncbi:MAG: winged helix-turn-helix transcriptional regulator [Fusobacteriaceae bacterium]|nr:winged helix-turn-helix transcriptional regulator [Fusobacteriaceae bacterium]